MMVAQNGQSNPIVVAAVGKTNRWQKPVQYFESGGSCKMSYIAVKRTITRDCCFTKCQVGTAVLLEWIIPGFHGRRSSER